MARPRNPDGVALKGFALGVNNVAPDYDLPNDEFGRPMALREAVNVDLVGPSKKPRQREGYAQKAAGRFHSPCSFGPRLLAVQDGDLRMYDSQATLIDVLRPGVGEVYISYAEAHGDLYWSNGRELRRVRGGDFADTPGWIDCPGTPYVAATPGTTALAAGTYRLAMTWFDADGRESGALGVAEAVLDAGDVLQVAPPPAPEGAVRARIYASAPDGDELYAALDVAVGATNVAITQLDLDGKALETLWRQPLPPCEILRFWNGRLIGAAGNLLVWSDALRFGLTTHDNYVRMGAAITLLEPVGEGGPGAGVWVCDHARTYWMDGATPKDWRRVIKSDVAAVPGLSLVVDAADVGIDFDGRVAVWMSADGVFTAGLPGGQLVDLTRGRLALPEGEHGAAMLRTRNGLQQLVMSYLHTNPNQLAIGDRASATVTRHTNP